MVKKRVLLAEDSPVTQDIVKLVLGQKGHEIEIANDGEETLEKLQAHEFDVALVDFHLPKMTGAEAVNRYLQDMQGKEIPYIVALTGDSEGLLSQEGASEQFEMIVPKPFRIEDIIPVIEADDAVRRIWGQEKPANPDEEIYENLASDLAMPFEDMPYFFVYFPRDFYGKNRNAVNMRLSSEGAPAAIFLTAIPTREQMLQIVNLRKAHTTPIIDLTGALGKRVDVSMVTSELNPTQIKRILDKFDELRGQLHTDFERIENIDEALLIRGHMNNGVIEPHFETSERSFVAYNTLHTSEDVIESMKRLERAELVQSLFYDRFNICPKCDSTRMIVREVCPICQSTHLREEYYLHHYRCAWQAPESDFRQGEDLVCPKCRYELNHFGKDYDKPGAMLVCENCNYNTTEPDISFKCLDCLTESKGEQIKSRDVKSFKLSPRAAEFLEAGRIVLGNMRQSFRFSDLPLELVVELNALAKDFMENQRPFALATIGYKNLRALERESGVRACDSAREVIRTNMMEALPYDGSSASGTAYDYFLIKDVDKQLLQREIDQRLERVVQNAPLNLDALATVFSAEDLGSV